MAIKKRPLLSKILLSMFGCIIILVIVTNISTQKTTSDTQASNFTLDTLQETEVTLHELKGKGVILSFWATYCPPCEKELPYLDKAYGKYKAQHVEIIGINVTEPRIIVNQFIQKRNIQFPIALDWNGNIAQQYNIITLPTTVVINAKGEVVKRITGELTEQQIEETIQLVKP